MADIYQKIVGVMRDMKAIGKDKKNAQQGYKYRGIDDVYNVINPLFAAHGVFMVPEVLEREREERTTRSGGNMIYTVLRVKYTLYADSDGSSVSTIVMGEGMDSADKSTNKAMSCAMKYALFQLLCIPTEEMVDADATTPEESKPVNAALVDKRKKECAVLNAAGSKEKAFYIAHEALSMEGKIKCTVNQFLNLPENEYRDTFELIRQYMQENGLLKTVA